jgi:hypothetical protein
MYIVVSVKTVDNVAAVRVVELCEGLILGGGARESAQFVEEGANDSNEAPHFNERRIHAKPRCQDSSLSAPSLHARFGFALFTAPYDSLGQAFRKIWMCGLLSIQVRQLSCIRCLM